jgi:hypothetical protein
MKNNLNKVLAVAAVAAAFPWMYAASAANIGFVVGSDGVIDKPFDTGWVTRLTSQGHTVTPFAQTTAASSPSLAAMNLFIISADVSSATVQGGVGLNQPQPYITYEYGIYDELFGGASGALAGGANNIVILNSASPLAAGLSGTVSVYTGTGDSSRVIGPHGAGAQVIAESAIASGNDNLLVLEAGQQGGIVGTTWPSRRIAVPVYDTWDPALVTADGWKLLDAAVAYAIVPEPSSVALLGLGLATLLARHRAR